MDLTSIRYKDTDVEIICCGIQGTEIVYKVLVKDYDRWTNYGPLWNYMSLVMVYRMRHREWVLKVLDQTYGLVVVGTMEQSRQLPYGHLLPMDQETESEWTRVTHTGSGRDKIDSIKPRILMEEHVYTLRKQVFEKIRPFSFSIRSRLRGDMKTRILELFIIFNRLFAKEGVRLPEEMVMKVLWYLEVITV